MKFLRRQERKGFRGRSSIIIICSIESSAPDRDWVGTDQVGTETTTLWASFPAVAQARRTGFSGSSDRSSSDGDAMPCWRYVTPSQSPVATRSSAERRMRQQQQGKLLCLMKTRRSRIVAMRRRSGFNLISYVSIVSMRGRCLTI